MPRKGYKQTPEHRAKTTKALREWGAKPESKERMKILHRGENNGRWKGVSASYASVHQWVARWLGSPEKCQGCGTDGLKGRYINWANKSGNYLRDLSDWLRLCTRCHYHFDRNGTVPELLK